MRNIPAAWFFKFALIPALIFLGGCIQQKESITIRKDGSGTVRMNSLVPKATVDYMDTIMGNMMQGMTQMAGGAASEKGMMPKGSLSEKMFGSRDELLKKAQKAGLRISMREFSSQRRDDGLHVDYEYEFDDINRLMHSELVSSDFRLKQEGGDLICFFEGDDTKAAHSREQLKEFKERQAKDEPDEDMSPEAKAIMEGMMEAMRSFKMEFYVTMPNEIKEVTGIFKKKDRNTAYVEFSGDLLNSPELIDQFYGTTLDTKPSVVCSADGLSFTITSGDGGSYKSSLPLAAGDVKKTGEKPRPELKRPLTGLSTLVLKDGSVVKGRLVEKNENFVKIEISSGIMLKYPQGDIESIEY